MDPRGVNGEAKGAGAASGEAKASKSEGDSEASGEQAPSWESDLDGYPLRPASEDPGWATATVWIWTGIALASIAFILWLLVMGLFYD
jgi:hypothetical protein